LPQCLILGEDDLLRGIAVLGLQTRASANLAIDAVECRAALATVDQTETIFHRLSRVAYPRRKPNRYGLRACWRALARLGARSKVGVRFGVRDDTLPLKNLGAEALRFGAGGRTRTDTGCYTPRILSPVRLPFRHTGNY
jgi:hypothetical protein